VGEPPRPPPHLGLTRGEGAMEEYAGTRVFLGAFLWDVFSYKGGDVFFVSIFGVWLRRGGAGGETTNKGDKGVGGGGGGCAGSLGGGKGAAKGGTRRRGKQGLGWCVVC